MSDLQDAADPDAILAFAADVTLGNAEISGYPDTIHVTPILPGEDDDEREEDRPS